MLLGNGGVGVSGWCCWGIVVLVSVVGDYWCWWGMVVLVSVVGDTFTITVISLIRSSVTVSLRFFPLLLDSFVVAAVVGWVCCHCCLWWWLWCASFIKAAVHQFLSSVCSFHESHLLSYFLSLFFSLVFLFHTFGLSALFSFFLSATVTRFELSPLLIRPFPLAGKS